MSTGRWQQLDRVFVGALELPQEQRPAFVASACGDDERLRAEALSLLSSAHESDRFMASPALDQLARAMAVEGHRLRAGDRLGAYVIERLLGAGGMGEVWRATDQRLGRHVAIKVLLPHSSGDADRLRRFADEARTAGSLNHSNIVAVYDVGTHGDAPFLVCEYLEGETLRKRLEKGALSAAAARDVALQVARGLAAAHARGIVHRDLKPDNVFLRSDGGVKILDFGVAKLQQPSLEDVPPLRTMTGIIVGTTGYMAPEQVRGESVDARTDLFALGVTMYEMLTRRRPFTGVSTVETLHAILTKEPPELVREDGSIPGAMTAIVERLLEKAPAERFQTASDLAWALERAGGSTVEPRIARDTRTDGRTPSARRLGWPIGGAIAATLLAAVLGVTMWVLAGDRTLEPGTPRLTRVTWAPPAGVEIWSEPAVSPDSTQLAFVGGSGGIGRLYVREFASLEPRALPGTDGAKQPFWSPDGTQLGFFANGKMMKVALDGGSPVAICPAPDARGGTWNQSDTIVFQSQYRDSSLSRVSAGGGQVEPATLIDDAGPDTSHRWPVFLPDGVHFLFFVVSLEDDRRGVYLGTIGSPAATPARRLFAASSGPILVTVPGQERGIVLTAEDRWIEARTFDFGTLEVIGDARQIEVPAAAATPHHPALLSASSDVLASGATPVPFGFHVAAISRTGTDLELWPDRGLGGFIRVSPDGSHLAMTRVDGVRGNPDIWVEDLTRGTSVRLTTARDLDVWPVWSPDARRIAYRAGTIIAPTLRVVAADASGSTEALPCPRNYCEPTDWAPGDVLIVNVGGGDIWGVPLDRQKPPYPIVASAYPERDARVSSDGRWIAYVSDESGRPEVSVRSMSGPPRRFAVSSGGGDQPVWRRDGKELFYVNGEHFLHAVSVETIHGGDLRFGVPHRLDVPRFGERHWGTVYDVSPDGARVYFPHPGNARPPAEFELVIGWRALLDRSK